jgi:hypothetical protein
MIGSLPASESGSASASTNGRRSPSATELTSAPCFIRNATACSNPRFAAT